MKKRNPLFVAGFPYVLTAIGYAGIQISNLLNPADSELSGNYAIFILIMITFFLIGVGYYLYWLILTARVLRRATGQKIPLAILLALPMINYWWMWRYGQAAEHFTGGKVQGVLAFAVIALAGPIGAGILQDYYNKQPQNPDPIVIT